MKALLLVDLQNDFFPGGNLPVGEGHKILPAINKLLEFPFNLIVATKDWHPKDHGSFAVNHNKEVGSKVSLNGLEQILWPVHCVKDTAGAEFAPGWNPSKVDKIIHKGSDKMIDSYSAFYDNGLLKSTGLNEFLNQKDITDIYIAGLATDYCVKYSVLDALHLGFNVFVVTDACKGVDLSPNDSDIALKEMHEVGAHLITSNDLE